MPTLARAPILASSSGTRPVSRRQIIQAPGPLPAPALASSSGAGPSGPARLETRPPLGRQPTVLFRISCSPRCVRRRTWRRPLPSTSTRGEQYLPAGRRHPRSPPSPAPAVLPRGKQTPHHRNAAKPPPPCNTSFLLLPRSPYPGVNRRHHSFLLISATTPACARRLTRDRHHHPAGKPHPLLARSPAPRHPAPVVSPPPPRRPSVPVAAHLFRLARPHPLTRLNVPPIYPRYPAFAASTIYPRVNRPPPPEPPERPREAPSTHQHPLLPPPCSAPPPHTRGAPLHLRSPHPVSFQFIPPSSTTAGPSLPRTLPPDLIAQCSHSTLQSPLPATHPLRPR